VKAIDFYRGIFGQKLPVRLTNFAIRRQTLKRYEATDHA
jgi:hypothetical protein